MMKGTKRQIVNKGAYLLYETEICSLTSDTANKISEEDFVVSSFYIW